MAFYLVTQMPKPKHRRGLSTCAVILEADTKAAAVRQAVELGSKDPEKWFLPAPDYCQPSAELLETGKVFRI